MNYSRNHRTVAGQMTSGMPEPAPENHSILDRALDVWMRKNNPAFLKNSNAGKDRHKRRIDELKKTNTAT